MASVLTSTLGTKGQVTLPKPVRELLGINEPGELVGFVVDQLLKTVKLTKLKVVPEDEELSEEEYRELLKLPEDKGGKTFSTMNALLKDLNKS